MTDRKRDHRREIAGSLRNEFLRRSMDRFAIAYREGQARAYAGLDKDRIVADIAASRDRAREAMGDLCSEFVANAEAKGMTVHRARTAEDANRIIAGIASAAGAREVVKSKSMTSEETRLNRFLEDIGLDVVETDLGEWIIQMRREGPSHMVMPAIHLSRYQVSELFESVVGSDLDPEDIDALVKVARSQLRARFAGADVGITGANVLIADSATVGLVTNEGNARLASTLPRTHIVLAGIDKVVPAVDDALRIIRALPRNATGQALTSYVTWITGRNESASSDDGRKDIHVVLLDNGRSEIAADPVFAEVSRCVRCGACANVCPVYRMVGGHTMGHVYIGAIGLILTYFFHGRDEAEKLVGNCIGCGACRNICAGGIDLPRLIKTVAQRLQTERGREPILGRLVSRVMTDRNLFHTLLKFGRHAQKPVGDGRGYLRHLPMMFAPEHDFKTLPEIADRSFRQMWPDLAPRLEAPRMTVALFAGCVQDFVYPEQLAAFVEILAAENIAVEFPQAQSCCGLPLTMMDQPDGAADVARQNLAAFDPERHDHIVTLCASCASHLRDYPALLGDADAATRRRAEAFRERVITSGSFLDDVVGLELPGGRDDLGKVTFHAPCHLTHCLKGDGAARSLIAKTGAEFARAVDETACCGFGGTYSVKYPEISAEILKSKIADFADTGAGTVITECPGCIMQLRGGVEKAKAGLEVRHLAELVRDAMRVSGSG